jgi:hypothetical protein
VLSDASCVTGLANALWAPGASGSWEFVYGVQDFRESQGIGYDVLQTLTGYSRGYSFLRP